MRSRWPHTTKSYPSYLHTPQRQSKPGQACKSSLRINILTHAAALDRSCLLPFLGKSQDPACVSDRRAAAPSRLWKGNSKGASVMRVSASVHQIHSASGRGVTASIFLMNAILLKLPLGKTRGAAMLILQVDQAW